MLAYERETDQEKHGVQVYSLDTSGLSDRIRHIIDRS